MFRINMFWSHNYFLKHKFSKLYFKNIIVFFVIFLRIDNVATEI